MATVLRVETKAFLPRVQIRTTREGGREGGREDGSTGKGATKKEKGRGSERRQGVWNPAHRCSQPPPATNKQK